MDLTNVHEQGYLERHIPAMTHTLVHSVAGHTAQDKTYLQENKLCFMLKEPSKGERMHCPIYNLAREIPEVCLEIVRFPHLCTSTAITGSKHY